MIGDIGHILGECEATADEQEITFWKGLYEKIGKYVKNKSILGMLISDIMNGLLEVELKEQGIMKTMALIGIVEDEVVEKMQGTFRKYGVSNRNTKAYIKQILNFKLKYARVRWAKWIE